MLPPVSSPKRPAAGHAIALLALTSLLAACVNESGTSALTSSEIQVKIDSHEQRHVASKCNSSDRLSNSVLASETLNGKYTLYSENEAQLSPERKSEITAALQSQGSQLAALDSDLNAQCVTWAKCEYQATSTKQNCEVVKHKYRDADKRMLKFIKQTSAIRVN